MEQLDPINIYSIAAFHAIGRCISLVLATIVPEKPSRELLEELPPKPQRGYRRQMAKGMIENNIGHQGRVVLDCTRPPFFQFRSTV